MKKTKTELAQIVHQVSNLLHEKTDQRKRKALSTDNTVLQNDLLPKLKKLINLTAISDTASEDLFESIKTPLEAFFPKETENIENAFKSYDLENASKYLERIFKSIESR